MNDRRREASDQAGEGSAAFGVFLLVILIMAAFWGVTHIINGLEERVAALEDAAEIANPPSPSPEG